MSSTEENLLWWVIPNVLAGMPMPFIHLQRRMNYGGALTEYEDDLPVLYRTGIRSVVSLLNNLSDQAIYESAGFEFLCLPISDGNSPTIDQANEFVRFVTAQKSANRATAVHCEAGLGRTGTMLAVYMISQGESAELAIRRVRFAEKAAVETSRQIAFLEQYAKEFERPEY